MKSERYDIEINFLERRIPLRVTHEEEIRIRKAVEIISEKIDDMKNKHKIKDKILLAMMSALEIGVELIEMQEQMENHKQEMQSLITSEEDFPENDFSIEE